MPILDRPSALAVAALYLVVVLAIGLWAARRTHSTGDYFIAGQRIGLWAGGLATMSAAFSGFIFVGGPGLTYRLGVSSLFIIVPLGVTATMLCWTLARRLRRLAGLYEIYTVPDAVQARFGSRPATALAAIAVLLGTIAYLGAQIQALGILLEVTLGTRERLGEWSLVVAMAVGVLVVLSYATVGGMLAGVYTDLFQGALMVLAACGVFYYAMVAGGGLGAIARRITDSDRFGPSFLDPLGGVPAFTALGFFFVFSVGVLGQPHMLHKFFMLRDEARLRFMPLVLGGSQALCVLIWLGIGLAVPALVAAGRMPPLDDPDQAAPLFLLGFVPAPLAGLVFAGVLAAIMSSADSFVNIASAALVRDLPRACGRPVADELRWGRLAVVLVAVGAALAALAYGDLVALLGTFAFGAFGAALAPCLVLGLCWSRVSAAAAAASMATGLAVHLGLEVLARAPGGTETLLPWLRSGVPAAAVALAASFTVLFVVTWLRPSPELSPSLQDVVELSRSRPLDGSSER